MLGLQLWRVGTLEAVAKPIKGSTTAKNVFMTGQEEKGSFKLDPGSCVHVNTSNNRWVLCACGHSRELPNKQFHSTLSFSNETL